MMRWFFLEKDDFWKAVLLTFVVLSLFPISIFIVWMLTFISILLLFRKPKINYKDSLSNATDIFLSPATGVVIDVHSEVENPITHKKTHTVKIAVPLQGPFGLYLPYSSKVNFYDEQEGKKIWRRDKKPVDLSVIKKQNIVLENKLGNVSTIQVLRCPLGGRPDIWIRPGDKGRSAANFGYMPFGGSILLSLPSDGDILVKKGDKVVSGETVIAGLKGTL
jgi:phosphatidylserine decarboxylase